MRTLLFQKFGVDVTAVDGVNTHVGYTFLTEVGPDVSRFASPEHFSSWLGVCPNNKVSGNRTLGVSTRPVCSRLATALRMAAQSLNRVESPLGDSVRRMRAKLGPAGAVTAAAHKIARILYTMITTRTAFDPAKLGNPELSINNDQIFTALYENHENNPRNGTHRMARLFLPARG